MSARAFGNSRPLGPNPAENRRVEITISGDQMGSKPFSSSQKIPDTKLLFRPGTHDLIRLIH
jgi:hypothetical protein